MWLLVLTIALAPGFEMQTTELRYLTEQDCRRALDKAIAIVADDGVIVIGQCRKAERR